MAASTMFAIASSLAVAVAPGRGEQPSLLTPAGARGTITSIDPRSGRVTIQASGGEELRVVVPPAVAAQFDRGDDVEVATQLTLTSPGDGARSGSGPPDAAKTGSGAPGKLHPPTDIDAGNHGIVE
jgi:hypothetical protein